MSDVECNMLNSVVTFTATPEEFQKLDGDAMPKIIISASGMATGSCVSFHLMSYASDYRNTILFTKYQASGTCGSRLMQGEKELKIHD